MNKYIKKGDYVKIDCRSCRDRDKACASYRLGAIFKVYDVNFDDPAVVYFDFGTVDYDDDDDDRLEDVMQGCFLEGVFKIANKNERKFEISDKIEIIKEPRFIDLG